jgi:hypothetical protein
MDMDPRRSERGEGKVGLLIALALLGSVIFIAVKVVPIRVNAYELKDFIKEEVRGASLRRDDKAIADRIMKKAKELEVPLERKNLKVNRSNSEMMISASFQQTIDLKVYKYVFRFNETERAPLF